MVWAGDHAHAGQLPDGRRRVQLGRRHCTVSRHDVKRLYVGDSSVIPRTLSVNPSLTIMALASRLAEHLDANESGYLRGREALVA